MFLEELRRKGEYRAVTTKESLNQLLDELDETQVSEILDFARFLRTRAEGKAWRDFSLRQLERAYAEDEPEYTLADVKTDGNE